MKRKYTWNLEITTTTGTATLLTGVSHKECIDLENIIRATAEDIDGISFHYYGKEV